SPPFDTVRLSSASRDRAALAPARTCVSCRAPGVLPRIGSDRSGRDRLLVARVSYVQQMYLARLSPSLLIFRRGRADEAAMELTRPHNESPYARSVRAAAWLPS